MAKYATGMRSATPQEKQWARDNVQLITQPDKSRLALLPPAHKNIAYLPVVGNQIYGTCTCWAAVYYQKTYHEAREHGWSTPDPVAHPEQVMSPNFCYNLINGGVDQGSHISSPFMIMQANGVPSLTDFPLYTSFLSFPEEFVWRAAIPNRCASVIEIDYQTPAGFLALKQHLSDGGLASIAIEVDSVFHNYPNGSGVDNAVIFQSGDPWLPPGAYNPNHVICAIGYDDNRTFFDGVTTQTGAILCVNSWGPNWGWTDPDVGTAGFVWISYDFIQTHATENAWAMEDRLGYSPTNLGVYDIDHNSAAELSIGISGGHHVSPDWSISALPSGLGQRPIQGRIVIDLTDFAGAGSLSYWLNVSDFNFWPPPTTGAVGYFAVELDGNSPWVSLDAPQETIDGEMSGTWGNLHLGINLFREEGAVFDGIELSMGFHQWSDMDQDGDLDLAICGWDGDSISQGFVFRNVGEGNFANSMNFPADWPSEINWGDFNGDGFPDLVVSAWDVTRLYINDGGISFHESGMSLPGTNYTVDWVDYDGDGDLDLAFFDHSLYQNNGDGTFTDSGITLPRSDVNRVTWADIDRDGNIDLVITGYFERDSVSRDETQVLLNEGNGNFSFSVAVGGHPWGAVSCGDVDNDGWIDIAAVIKVGDLDYETRIFRNNGDGSFIDFGTTLPGAVHGMITWGDLDNDGLQDLGICGDGVDISGMEKDKFSFLFGNRGNGTFVNFGIIMPGVSNNGVLQFSDYDGDGDLDVSLSGNGILPLPTPSYSRLYRNLTADPAGFNRPNQSPTPPVGLLIDNSGPGLPLTLSWDSGTDQETPEDGLFYNVRVGRNPGWGDIISGVNVSPLMGGRMRPTLDGSTLGVVLNEAPAEPVFFSVQSIDSGLKQSTWSVPEVFSPDGSNPGDLNGDDIIDIRDVVLNARMVNGSDPPNIALADRNNDGVVDAVDVRLTGGIVLQGDSIDQSVITWSKIDSTGGILSTGDFYFQVPAGAFSFGEDVIVREFTDGVSDPDSISATFMIDGVPDVYDQPLTCRLRANGSEQPGTVTYASIQETVFVTSLGLSKSTTQYFPVTHDGQGWYEFTFPPISSSALKIQLERGETPLSGYKHSWRVGILTGRYHFSGSHFDIAYPTSVSSSDVVALAGFLEEAYATFSDPLGANFDYTARTKWPISVIVNDQGTGGWGTAVNSKFGNNYGYMEFNKHKMSDAAGMRISAGHEFFHLVQALYDPRDAFSKAVFRSQHLWLDEACSTWAEGLFSSDPNYIPPFYSSNKFDFTRTGLQVEGSKAPAHGYGYSSIINFLVDRKGQGALRTLYDEILAGYPPTSALREAYSSTLNYSNWFVTYFNDLLRGDIYAFGADQIDYFIAVPKHRKWNIKTEPDLLLYKNYLDSIPDLGFRGYMVLPNIALPADSTLFVRVEDALFLDIVAVKFKDGSPSEFIKYGTYRDSDRANVMEIPGFSTIASEGWNVIIGVVNHHENHVTTGTTLPLDIGLGMLMTRTIDYNQTAIVAPQVAGEQFPTFIGNGSLTGRGMLSVYDQPTQGYHVIVTEMIGEAPYDFDLVYSVVPENQEVVFPTIDGTSARFTFSQLKSFELEIIVDGTPVQTLYSNDGNFSFSIDPIPSEQAQITLSAVYDVLWEEFDANGPISAINFNDIKSAVHIIGLSY